MQKQLDKLKNYMKHDAPMAWNKIEEVAPPTDRIIMWAWELRPGQWDIGFCGPPSPIATSLHTLSYMPSKTTHWCEVPSFPKKRG